MMDETYFTNAKEFDPEHFLPGFPYTLLAFGRDVF